MESAAERSELSATRAVREEVSALGRAKAALNRGSPAETLAILAEYRARFPQGRLRPEAAYLEMEAELARGNRERANLISQDCLDRHGSEGVSDQTRGCSTEQRIIGCQQDVLFDHLQSPPECDDAWRAVVRCKAQATFDPDCNGASLGGGEIPPKVCPQEVWALFGCGRTNPAPSTEIKGTRTTCTIYTSGPGISAGQCSVGCSGHLSSFGSRCSVSEPRRCDCVVNAHILGGGAWSNQAFYEGTCEQTAKAMADGEWCTNHLDCCLEYVKDGVKRCDCGADASCEEARQTLDATRVDRCAKYNAL